MMRLLRFIFCVMLACPAIVAANGTCREKFIEHVLPHITLASGTPVRFYESNGSGLAINDLNNDGRLDIVLGGLANDTSILWNAGALAFRQTYLPREARNTRAVLTVDVDADGWLDIVTTSRTGAPAVWMNGRDETFTFAGLPGVRHPATAIQFADADGDGDLDLATGSYDAELNQLQRDAFLFGGGAGVYYYENTNGDYQATRLADGAQALAIWLSDLDGDGAHELIVGNDFRVPDAFFALRDGAWAALPPPPVITYSTMSFDAADIDNDGAFELFAADMQPMHADPDGAWRYVFDSVERAPLPDGDPQRAANALYQRDQAGTWSNVAESMGVDAAGWAWSARFGDLDHDGFPDLYVVNGMQAAELFPHLPDDALVEPNAAFRNLGGRGFEPAPDWGLGSLAGGRGMSMADLDSDGDLDIVVNNLNAPARLFENGLCTGDSLQVELRWPGSPNPFGIGAVVTLTTTGSAMTRDLRAGSGYLSGDPARVHFGFPDTIRPLLIEVRWPDGVVTRHVPDIPSLVIITRS